MKKINLLIALSIAVVAWLISSSQIEAARPNPPTIAGTVPILNVIPPGGTNAVPLPPRIHVLDEHGRAAADIEATVTGNTGTFNIPLKKAGTYVVWAYYPAPNQLHSAPQVADVLKKSTATVSLVWPAIQ